MAVRFNPGTPTIESRPKRLVKVNQSIQYLRHQVEIKERRNIEVKVGNVE